MKKAYRHGDICLLQTKSVPKGLVASKDNVLIKVGSGGKPHSFTGGTFYPKQEGDFILGYLKAKGTKLFHVEHSPQGAELPNGIYEVRKQVEVLHEGLRPVQD